MRKEHSHSSEELQSLHQRIAELEQAEIQSRQIEEKLRRERDFNVALIQASPLFFVSIGIDGKTLMMNEAMLSALGYESDEVVGVDYLTRFVPEGDRESLSQIFEKLMQSRVPTLNENHVLTKDGRELLVEWHGRPVFTEGGEFDFFFGVGIDITERKIAQERIAHLNLVLRAIRNVNQLIASEKDRDRLLQGACDSLIETRGYHTAWIGLFDEEKGLVGISQAGRSEEFATLAARLKRGELPICAQMALAQPGILVIEESHSECADCPLSGTHRGQGVMAVRLEHAGKVYGMLSASIPAGLISDDEEHALLAEVAADIAFALYSIELEADRKRTEEALNLKLKQLDALSAASRAVSTSLDPKQVLETIVSLAREAVGADYTSVMLVDKASDTVRSAEHFSGVPSIEYRIRTKGLTSLIMDTGQAVIIDEIGKDGTITPDLGAGAPRLINPHIMKANIKSVAGLPLTGKDRSLGVLYLHSLQPGAFHHQETLLTTFANQAATAVENAWLHETVLKKLDERKQAEETLRESERRLRIMSRVLAELSQSKRLLSGDLNALLKEITEAAARMLEVERVSVWFYNEERSKIHCIDQYELTPRRHSGGCELAATDQPAYFTALEQDRTIAADNAHTDPRTKGYSETYLSPHGITSILDAPIRLGGRMIGIIAHAHVGLARQWTLDEQNFAGSIADFISLAMETQKRRQAEETLHESERCLRIMSRVLAELSQSKKLTSGDLNACLKEITEAAARTLDVERVSVWLYDKQGSKIHCIDQYESGPKSFSTSSELSAADNPAYFRALEEERAIVADDAQTDPRTKGFSETYLTLYGITSMLDAPIRLGGRMIGIIAHAHVGPARQWTLDEQNFAGSIADFISLAMEAQKRRQAERALEKSEQKIESLHEIARRLAICETEDNAYRLTVEAAEQILEFSLCSLDIVEQDRLVVKATSSELPPEVSVWRPLAEGGLAAKTYRTGKTTVFGSLDEVPEATPTSADFKSGISAPIGDIGVFQVVSTQANAFTKDDVRRLELLLGHTAEAIKRIHLQNELREQAIRDPLTGVYNRRYLMQTIAKEIARSTRYDRPIAFLMIDVNQFKEINDRFGHQTGDRVLQEMGNLLQEQVRESDTVIRYGGDEFLIILPETDGETKIVEERINAGVASRNTTNQLIDFPVTLSIGSAYWTPGGTQSVEEVLAEADSRMYEAKREHDTGKRPR